MPNNAPDVIFFIGAGFSKYSVISIVIKKNLGIPVEYYDIPRDKLAVE